MISTVLLKVSKRKYIMTRKIEFDAVARTKMGSSGARADRANKLVPGIIYGLNKDNESIALPQNELVKHLSKPGFRTTLFDIKIGSKAQQAVVQDIQFHPVTDMPIHIDFKRIDTKTPIEISVPIKYVNREKSPGLKRGGTLNTVMHRISVSCLATNIPEYINVDLAGVNGGDRVTLKSLKLPENVTLGRNSQPTVCTLIKGRGKASDGAGE